MLDFILTTDFITVMRMAACVAVLGVMSINSLIREDRNNV